MDDGFGDPLPEGAHIRIGSIRLAHASVTALVFGNDGFLYSASGAPTSVSSAPRVKCWGPGGVLRRTIATEVPVTSLAVTNVLHIGSGPALVTLDLGGAEETPAQHMLPPSGNYRNLVLGLLDSQLAVLSGSHLATRGRVWGWNWRLLPLDGDEPVAAFGGNAIAAADARGGVRIVSAQFSEFAGELSLGGEPSALALSNSAGSLAAGFPDGRIAIWDVASGKQVSEWPAHPARIGALAFSADGTVLASAGFARLRLWNPATGGERVVLPTLEEPPAALSFHPGAPRIVTRSGLSLKEWDSETGVELSEVAARGIWDDGNRMPDSRYRVVEDRGQWNVWDTALGRSTLSIQEEASACAMSPDGTLFACAGPSKSLRLFDGSTGRKLWSARLDSGHGPPSFVRFLPDGSGVLAGRTFEEIYFLDISSGHRIATFAGPVALSRDGKLLASSMGNGDDVQRTIAVNERSHDGWKLWRVLGPIDAAPRAIAFAPFARLLAVATDQVLVWNLDDPAGPRIRYAASAHDLVFSPDGRRLATICWLSATTLVWDVPR